MSKKPNRATGYDARHVDHVRAACLYVATKLGDLIEIDSVGPRRVAELLIGRPDDAVQADARGLVLDLLELCACQ